MTDNTVSKEIYKKLLEHGGYVASGELESWDILGATGSTITRKARMLADSGYLEVKYEGEHNHAHYMANKVKKELGTFVTPKAPPKLTAIRWNGTVYFRALKETTDEFLASHPGSHVID